MTTPETAGKNEAPATPEDFIARDIAEGLLKMRQLRQLVARGERTQGDLDALKDALHARLDEGIENMEWFGRRDEVGDATRLDKGTL
jgi:hypothetical protein